MNTGSHTGLRRGAAIAVSVLALAGVSGAGAGAALAAVPEAATQTWSDPSGDATGNVPPPVGGVNQPSKDLIDGFVCNDDRRLRFFLRLADLGEDTAAAANGVPQVEWQVQFKAGSNTYFVGAMLAAGGESVYREGTVVAGVETPYAKEPTGAFGTGPFGIVELDAALADFGRGDGSGLPIAAGTVITDVTARVVDSGTSIVDVAGAGGYTIGDASSCGRFASPAPEPGPTYYVSPTGSDSADGTSLATPFRTIQRCADVAPPGATCAIRGGTYREAVRPGDGVTFTAYDFEDVTVTGADVVSGWNRLTAADLSPVDALVPAFAEAVADGRIYRAPASLNPELFANQVFVDGTMLHEARWPPPGANVMTPTMGFVGVGTTPGVITTDDPAVLTGRDYPPDYWAGGTIHVCGGACWTVWDGQITASGAGHFAFSSPYNSPGYAQACPYACAGFGNQFYVSGKVGALSAPGGWFYDAAQRSLLIHLPDGADPSTRLVEAKQRNFAFDMSGSHHVTISGLSVFAASITTDEISADNLITDIRATHVSHFTTVPPATPVYSFYSHAARLRDSGIILRGSGNTLRNSVVTYSAGDLVSLQGSNNTVTNNLLREGNYGGTFGGALYVEGSHQMITNNTVYNAGMVGISLYNFAEPSGTPGVASSETYYDNYIGHNKVFNTHVRQQDGGGIYVCCGKPLGVTIANNHVHDLLGKNPRGTKGYGGGAVYFDLKADGALIHHNVTWNAGDAGLILNGHPTNRYSRSNRVFNNTFGPGQKNAMVQVFADDMNGSEVTNNIFSGPTKFTKGASLTTNLMNEVDPVFADPAAMDFHLQSGSPGIDAGTVIGGITDGFAGAAPDIGAYEAGVADPTVGCTFTGCKLTTIDNSSPQWSYSGTGWTHCSSCHGDAYPYGGTISGSLTADDAATITFDGSGAILHLQKGIRRGLAAVSVDGGPETIVDTYLNSGAGAGDQVVWSAYGLGPGTHTVKVRVTGQRQHYSGFATIEVDRVEVVPHGEGPPAMAQVTTSMSLAAPASAETTDEVSVTATLTAEDAPVSGQVVEFALGAFRTEGVTDGEGVAIAIIPLDMDPADVEISATFTGAGRYRPSSATSALRVVRDGTTTRYTGETRVVGEEVVLAAVLADEEGPPLAGQPIVFSVEGQTLTATTDDLGRATATVRLPDHGRSVEVTAAFRGSSRHRPSETGATLTWGA